MIQADPANPFVKLLINEPLVAIVRHYASCLAANAKALRLVSEELKLTPEQAAKEQIGFADRSLGTLIPPKTVKSGREIRDLLTALGVYKANGRETLRGRVTVPIRDEQGAIIGIRGHKLDKHVQGPEVIEVGGRRETGEGRQEAGDGRQEAGGRRREP
jgi:DNA primase